MGEKGVDTPRLDAEVLLADLLAISRVDLYINYDRPLNHDELAGFRERVKRRAAREPVAYITGAREFYSLDFQVGPEVLIPRPETELLVDETIRLADQRWPDEELRLLDLGSGSGAVAVTLAVKLGRAGVWAVDINEAALAVAKRNAAKHLSPDAIHFFQGDLFEPLSGQGLTFHLITANLPYIPRPAMADLAPEVKNYEPHLALDGGEEGLDLIARAISGAGDHLAEKGALLLEIWPDHPETVKALALDHGFKEGANHPGSRRPGPCGCIGYHLKRGVTRHGQDHHRRRTPIERRSHHQRRQKRGPAHHGRGHLDRFPADPEQRARSA